MADLESRVTNLENLYHQMDISFTRTEGKIDTILATMKGLQGCGYMTETKVENLITKTLVKSKTECFEKFVTRESMFNLLNEYFKQNPVVTANEFNGKWDEAHKAKQTFWSKMAFGAIGAIAAVFGMLFSIVTNLSQHVK